MNTSKLPARVRVSELSNLPSETVLGKLGRLEPEQSGRLENLSLEPGKVRLAVALAGGSPIGYALRRNLELTVVVAASWRGKEIEVALENLLENRLEPPQPAVILPSSTASWTVLESDAPGCDPVTGICEVTQDEGVAVSSLFIVLDARADVLDALKAEET